jgi:hypothetical protein
MRQKGRAQPTNVTLTGTDPQRHFDPHYGRMGATG